MTFKAEYYPDDIAEALCRLAGEDFPEDYDSRNESPYSEALYHLMAICENKYNNEYYRSFYRLLERVTAAHERI